MFKFKFQVVILLPILLFLFFPTGRDFTGKKHTIAAPEPEIAAPRPCAELHVTNAGVVCGSRFGIVAHLDFPEVDLLGALASQEYLPQAQALFTADEKTVGDKNYRNIAFVLRWEPATPEFLQIYLNEYIPYWGNRVPYRLFWNIRYEECSLENCAAWVTVDEKGELLPTDINDLQSDLAADVNFNGVPAAFWNENVTP